MPKLKSHSGAKKRFKVTGSGKVKAASSNRRHILSTKAPKRKRQSRKGFILGGKDASNIKTMLLK